MAIRYHYDLYPRTSPRDGARIRRFTKLQEAIYRDVIGVGSGAGVIRSTTAEAADLDPLGEQYIRVVEENTATATETVRAGFWINRFNHDTAVAKETKRLTFSGAGHLAYLARARMWSHTYMGAAGAGAGITTGAQDPFDDLWRLWNQGDWAGGDFLGSVFWRVIMEALSYQSGAYTHRHKDGLTYTDTHTDDRTGGSAISLVTLGFDKDEDSDGNPWSVPSGEFQASVGENVLSVTQRLMQAGLYVEMDPDTFELRAWENDEHRRDRTGGAWGASVVRFQAPTDATVATGNMLSDSERELNSHLKRTIILAGGQDAYARATAAGDVRWEGFEPSTAAESSALQQLASTQITARSEAADAGSVRMKLGVTPLSGRYRPWEEVRLDDLVTVHTGTGEWDYDEATYPVAGLKIELQKSGAWWAWAELGASFSPGADRRFQVPPVPAHTHPLPLCTPFLPSEEVQTGRIYFSNDDETVSGLDGGSDYSPSWDHTVIAAGEPRALYSTPQSTLTNSGVGNPYTQTDAPAQTVATDMWARRLSDLPAAVLATVQAGGQFRMAVRSKNRTGVGISSDQQNFPDQTARIYRPGTSTFIGTLFDVGDATGGYVFAESNFVVIPITADVAAVPSAVGTDILVLELGGDHITPTTGGTGWAYRPGDSSAEDLPFVVDSAADQNAWAEFSTAGAGGTGDGHVDLIGTAMRAKRCDDTEHWHSDRAPTAFDDESVGIRVGTLWLDDTTGRVWWLTDNTAGAAVWILITDPSGGGGGGGSTLIIEEEDGTPSDSFDTLKVPNTSLTDNGDGSASLDFALPVHIHDPATPGFHGVLVHRGTDFTTTNSNDSIPDFDTAIYDTDGAWEGVTNPDRITVPAEWDGLMLQIGAWGGWSGHSDTYVEMKLYRNGTSSEANLIAVTQHATNAASPFQELLSPPVQVATGDYFTITFRTPASRTLITYNEASILFGAWIVGSGGGGTVTEEEVRDAGRWEVVVSGTAPPVAVSTPADDDWVYAWVPGP